MLLEVSFAQKPAALAHEHFDLIRDLAFVENVPPSLTDQAQCFRKRRIFEDIAFAWRMAFSVERVRFEKRAGKSFVESGAERPVIRDQVGDRKTFFGIMDRGREIVGKF